MPVAFRPWLVAITVIALAGAVARLACAGAEFWLDEIWSWQLAHSASSPVGIFAIRHDNNHVLNSLWLQLWPATAPLPLLRLHSLLAGIGTIVLAAVVARRGGRAASVFAACLVAGCAWLVFASAEARGYALALLLALAALEALWRHLDGNRWGTLIAFWAFSMLGFLAHLTFVHAYVGFVVWSMRRYAGDRKNLGELASSTYEIGRMLLCHGPVAVFFLAYYCATIRGMEVGGGPPAATADVLGRLISLGLGGPAGGLGCWVGVALAVVFCFAGLRLMAKSHGDAWTFFAATTVGAPGLFLVGRLISGKPDFLFERYFFVSFLFFLLLAAFVLGDLWQRKQFRFVAIALLLAFLGGNAWHVRGFVKAGRGEFEPALTWIAESSSREEIIITGDADFRVRLYADFYAQRRGRPERFRYLPDKASGKAAWYLEHRNVDEPRPEPPALVHVNAGTFQLERAFPARGRWAWGWFVYRRVPD